jgi:hypothetical protein
MGELVVRRPVYWLVWAATVAMGFCIVGMVVSQWL